MAGIPFGRLVLAGLAALIWSASVEATPIFSAQVVADANACGGSIPSPFEFVARPFSAEADVLSAGTCNHPLADGAVMAAAAGGTASLATGHLTAAAGTTGFDSSSPILAIAAGRAELFDILTIHGPAPAFATTAGVRLTVEGNTAGFSYAEAYISLNGLTSGPPSQFKPQCKDTGTSGMFASCSLVSPEGPFAFDILMNVPVSSADPSFPIRVGIYAGAVNEGLSDILGSGQLSIVLPPGFTFTSASGVLLTGPPKAVPEPAMILLLGVGAAMTIRRRRGRGADGANGSSPG